MSTHIDSASLLNECPVTQMRLPGSLYTRKMLAALRFRQIPYRFCY